MMKRLPATTTLALLGCTLVSGPALAQQTGALPARDRMLAGGPATVFTVGAADGESWEMFSGITGMAFDRADNLYVLDSQNTRVVIFDASGRFLRQFGKRGAGPGELQMPIGIAVTADGAIVVNDVGNLAFVVFRATGEHVKNVPYALAGTVPLGPIQADPRGGVVARANDRLSDTAAAPPQSGIYRQQLDEQAAPVPIARFEMPPPQVLSPAANRRMIISVEPVFSARPSFGVLPDGGIALHHGSEYAVKIFDAGGRHTRTLTRPISPRSVTKKDRDSWQARNRESEARGGGTRVVITGTMGGGGNASGSFGAAGGGGAAMPVPIDREFADLMSVVTGIRTDPDGRIWVQRRHADGSDAGPIDLADASGRYIGTLPAQPLPAAFSRSGLAAYVVRDDIGIERVSVLRLPQSWR
jgi:hypothetical protein